MLRGTILWHNIPITSLPVKLLCVVCHYGRVVECCHALLLLTHVPKNNCPFRVRQLFKIELNTGMYIFLACLVPTSICVEGKQQWSHLLCQWWRSPALLGLGVERGQGSEPLGFQSGPLSLNCKRERERESEMSMVRSLEYLEKQTYCVHNILCVLYML